MPTFTISVLSPICTTGYFPERFSFLIENLSWARISNGVFVHCLNQRLVADSV